MQVEPVITFHGMAPSANAEEKIIAHIGHLEATHGRIVSCRVTVEAPHHHGRQGAIYQVSIDIRAPAGEVTASNAHEMDHAHEDLLVAIRDAFDAAERRLEDLVRRRDPNRTKVHPTIGHGAIARIVAADGYGFIATPDGREFYFDRGGMSADAWDELKPGTPVRFDERDGERGPYATAVRPL
ncbi:HPF/RaiA family ribosome-associated protein [Propylenella binzhouense]|uniref:HPF/RaiA family ribosome-associated protein n=1 Tax=Propylenella binzhouense TaxID=2555902 RepID=A0A964T3B9_9HYPH|nr:HPF/RaiA family ribosome-associated protein [Propylenella binzhouense]MYZ47529.1 HPF/RaiA family ribosome-associated protein [Propylenella binzhouense]